MMAGGLCARARRRREITTSLALALALCACAGPDGGAGAGATTGGSSGGASSGASSGGTSSGGTSSGDASSGDASSGGGAASGEASSGGTSGGETGDATTDAGSTGAGEPSSAGFTPTGLVAFSNTNTRRGEWNDEGGLDTDARNFLAFMASASRDYVPDIMTLQETDNRYAANYRTCEAFRAKLEAYVKANGHPKIGGYSMYPPYADSWEGGSCVIFRKRWSYVDHAWIYPFFEEDGVTCTRRKDDTKPKVLVLRLEDEEDGRRLAVASVHLDKGPQINCHQETLEDVAAHPLMSGVAGQIIAGDFNNGHSEMLAPAGWSRVPLTSSTGEAWTHGKSQPLGERTTLDHIFVKGGTPSDFALVEFNDARDVSTFDYSDHRGGLMTFAY